MIPVQELRARITSSTQIPEPTNIQSTGDWYYLDHLSSGLVAYDADKKTFVPMLASSWEEAGGGAHSFEIRPGIKFHDGTPITAQDIVWSVKRHLIFKTSTHFPFWEYLEGCENIKTLRDECPGIRATGNRITLRLKAQTDSFYLQMASPETGIWWAGDMNADTGELKATKFSGPYFVSERTDEFSILKRNPFSLLSDKFPDSPRSIRLLRIPLSGLDQALVNREVDVAIKQYTPLGEHAWETDGIKMHATAPSSIIYLFGLGIGKRPAIGRDLMTSLWAQNADRVISPADSFLPFAGDFGLTRGEFLDELPEQSGNFLRIATPDGFFPEAFLQEILKSADSIGTKIEFYPLKQSEFFKAFGDPKASERYDYILSIYAASERYPAVQLRYLTNGFAKPPIDLKKAESPDQNEGDRTSIFRSYEKWLLSSQHAIPIYFDVTLFLHQPKFDIGDQSLSDAEIELWRVRERAP